MLLNTQECIQLHKESMFILSWEAPRAKFWRNTICRSEIRKEDFSKGDREKTKSVISLKRKVFQEGEVKSSYLKPFLKIWYTKSQVGFWMVELIVNGFS